jgi:hypothetical protein
MRIFEVDFDDNTALLDPRWGRDQCTGGFVAHWGETMPYVCKVCKAWWWLVLFHAIHQEQLGL